MDVVTIGETMVLFVPDASVPLRFAGQFGKTIGGAESNVAIGLARLGHQAGWISRLGNDEFGHYVHNFIRGEGVDTSRVTFDDRNPTAVFFKERRIGQEPKVYYYRAGSAASRLSREDLDESYIARAKFLHLTGITPALSASCADMVQQAIRTAKRHGLQIVFDPNIRRKLWTEAEAKPVLLQIASQAEIVMPGLDEGQVLTGKTTPEEIAEALLAGGAKTVVVKLGERGAYYRTAAESGYVDGFQVAQIVDPIGAGDAFAAGFLSGLLRGWPLREAVGFANRVAAFVLTTVGDVEGLPFWAQVDPGKKTGEVLR